MTFDDATTLSLSASLSPIVEITMAFGGSVANLGGGSTNDIPFELVSNEDILAGFPVAVNRANGKLIKAVASLKSSAFVVGLLLTDVSSGFVGSFSASRIQLNDWTAVTGSQHLLPGQTYFLSSSGGLTTNPPSSPSCITIVGNAIDVTTFSVGIRPPIQL